MNKVVNLALQGGGAHGAFTWGVLEQLLLDNRITFKSISGTSAGGMNGAVLVYGLIKGGPEAAIALLEKFWRRVSESGRFGLFFAPNALDQFLGPMGKMAVGAYMGFDMLSKFFSPYQFGMSGENPLRRILLDLIDFEVLRNNTDYNLHVSATDVLESRLKIFSGKELSVDALLASACLPQLFQAVSIDGHYYWDGGFMGNPPLYPLTRCKATHDIMIVQIDPVLRTKLPTSAEDIADRLNEISFNSPLLVELRGMRLVNGLLKAGHLKTDECGLRHLHVHMVGDDQAMADLSLESKFNPDWGFLQRLREAGKYTARLWLEKNYDKVGVESTLDLDKLTD